jgi:HK97 family phage major capsid protein
MSAYLQGLVRERASLGEAAKNVYDQAAEHTRELKDEERTNVEKWEARCAVLDKEIERLTSIGEASTKFAALAERSGALVAERRQAAAPAAAVQHRSAGERFTHSDAFKGYNGRGSSAAFDLGQEFLHRAAITTQTTDGRPAMWWSGPPTYTMTTPLLDELGRVATSQGTVEYLYQGTADPMAALVAEGALKPEANIVLELKTLTLNTYAHWEAITRQALADIPRIQSIIDGKLRRGVLAKLENEAATVLGGATSGIPAITGATTTLGLIRQSVASVQAAGYQPRVLAMNPADLANADLDAMATTLNGPQQTPNYWGLTPVAVGALPVGTAFVGDFNAGLTWFDRTGTEAFISDSHADFFIRNQLVILAEARAAFAVTEPVAMAKFTIPADAPAGA